MKKLFTVIFILFHGHFAFSQKIAREVEKEGMTAIRTGKYATAIANFKYLLEKQPRDENIAEWTFYLGFAYSGIGQFENEGKNILEKLLDLDPGEQISYVAHVKHRAAFQLYKCFKERKVYDSALRWLYLADTVYTYGPVCGTDYESNMLETHENFLEIYRLADRHQELKQLLLRTAVIEYSKDTASASELKGLLMRYENIAALKQEFDSAIKHWAVSGNPSFNNRPCFTGICFEERIFGGWRYITFQGANMYVDRYVPKGKSKSEVKKESLEFVRKIKTTAFYKMLQSL